LKTALYNGNMNYNTYAQLATLPNAHNNNANDLDGIPFYNNAGQQMAATIAGVGFLYADEGLCQDGYGANSKTVCKDGLGFCGGLPYRTTERDSLKVSVPIGNTTNPSFANNMGPGRFNEVNIRQGKVMAPYN